MPKRPHPHTTISSLCVEVPDGDDENDEEGQGLAQRMGFPKKAEVDVVTCKMHSAVWVPLTCLTLHTCWDLSWRTRGYDPQTHKIHADSSAIPITHIYECVIERYSRMGIYGFLKRKERIEVGTRKNRKKRKASNGSGEEEEDEGEGRALDASSRAGKIRAVNRDPVTEYAVHEEFYGDVPKITPTPPVGGDPISGQAPKRERLGAKEAVVDGIPLPVTKLKTTQDGVVVEEKVYVSGVGLSEKPSGEIPFSQIVDILMTFQLKGYLHLWTVRLDEMGGAHSDNSVHHHNTREMVMQFSPSYGAGMQKALLGRSIKGCAIPKVMENLNKQDRMPRYRPWLTFSCACLVVIVLYHAPCVNTSDGNDRLKDIKDVMKDDLRELGRDKLRRKVQEELKQRGQDKYGAEIYNDVSPVNPIKEIKGINNEYDADTWSKPYREKFRKHMELVQNNSQLVVTLIAAIFLFFLAMIACWFCSLYRIVYAPLSWVFAFITLSTLIYRIYVTYTMYEHVIRNYQYVSHWMN